MSGPLDYVGKIIAYESGEMETQEEVVEFFQGLIDSKMIYSLQGSYQRMAQNLIDADLCTA